MAVRILVVDDSQTIRKVVSSILERNGYEVAAACDGEEALDVLRGRAFEPDLVLLDHVMPRLDGYQLCLALRAEPRLAATPVVLMSAKGDRIRDRFVEQTGALDAITKPFDGKALVAAVEGALRRVNRARAGGSRLPDDTGDIPAAMVTAAAELDLASREEPGRAILAGDLGAIPVGAVLQLLQAENVTGVLVCRSGGAEVRATFRDGNIDLAQSSGAGDEFRLGRYLVEEGIVTAAQIEAVMERAGDPAGARDLLGARRPLGMALLAAGWIGEPALRAALAKQSCELLYEVLRWQRGAFELRREAPSELAVSARLALPVASVVMEGFRRVDEWRALERALGSFDVVLVRDRAALAALDPARLSPREQAVLAAVDGERTVRDIVSASQTSSFDACRALVQLLEARVLRRRG